MSTIIVGGEYHANAINIKSCESQPIFKQDFELEALFDTHKQVPLIEAVWRLDKGKGLTFSNTKPKFINIQIEKRLKFIRARTLDHSKHFIDNNKHRLYEKYEDGYDDFCELPPRLQKIMTCAQLLSEFDKCDSNLNDSQDHDGPDVDVEHDDEQGVDDDQQDDDLDGNNEQHEENTATLGVLRQIAVCNNQNYGDLNIPNKIRLKNGGIYKRRTTMPKIISYPLHEKNTDEFIITELLLFRPHERDMFTGLSSQDLHLLYTNKDRIPERGVGGKIMTQIETIKLRLKPTMCDIDKDSESTNDYIIRLS